MSDPRRIPPPWIDLELIQTSLRLGHADPDLTVKSFSIKPAIPVGDNYCSDMFRVTAELEGAKPVSIIFKILPQAASKDILEQAGFFKREVTMFTHVLDKMFQTICEGGVGPQERFSAKCLHAGLKPKTFMALEDLSVSGFKTAERRKGLDLDHSLMVVRSLARFHASSAVLLETEPKLMEMYKESVHDNDAEDSFENFINGAAKSLIEVMEKNEEFELYVPKVRKFSDSLHNRIRNSMIYKEGKFNVLLHGDLWVNNIMFKYSDEGVVDLRFVDFQLGSFSSPAFDLHYFFNTSTNEEVHTQHLDQLLREYHNVLDATLSKLGYGHKTISLEELIEEMNEHVFYVLYSTVSVLPIILANPKDGIDIQKNLENLREGESSPPNPIYENERYLSFMKRLLPEMERRGCFDDL